MAEVEEFSLAVVFELKALPSLDAMELAGQVVHERARAAFGPSDTCSVHIFERWADFLGGLVENGMPSAGIAIKEREWPAAGFAVGVIHNWVGTRTIFDDERSDVHRLVHFDEDDRPEIERRRLD